jgi:hypothetical protein
MKTKHQPIRTVLVAVVVLASLVSVHNLCAQGTAFSYQGQLNDSGAPANGGYDLTFALFSDSSGVNQVGNTLTNLNTGVTNGLFAVTLDFGPGVFTGTNLWLQVGVRTNGGTAFTELAPLQAILAAPYAIMANSASNLLGTLPAAQLSGTVANGQLANNSITINAGTGLSGGGTVALGGSTTLNNVGVLSVTGNADISASTVNGAVTLGDTATDADTSSTLVRRDANGDFSAATISLDGNLYLPTTTGSAGIIYTGGGTLLDSYGTGNFFAGLNAGNLTMSGAYNSGIGAWALWLNTSGSGNTANGAWALLANTSGSANVANGYAALYFNTSGCGNTANGEGALFYNMSGNNNTANGFEALYSNTTGSGNTANGLYALCNNTNGSGNTANGSGALFANTSGYQNTGIGFEALYANTNGSDNIALGYMAGYNVTAGNDNIDIGNTAVAGDDSMIRIGTQGTHLSTYIAGIYGATLSDGSAVYVSSSGQLGTSTSSRRFKQDIQPMGDASDVLLALRPVTFRYKPDIDPQGIPQFGLVAEEVEQVDPDLIVRDKDGEPYSVRYEQVNAMLLNEFLKEHRKVEQLESWLQKLERLLNAKNGGGQ